ncbi:ribosomal protein S5 domain 2-type protein [Lipomyces oligophaga]|uniref:ribosomal protein S5 domain 2-type protein n=1 Tax=Lipomyces oligophaga TaxID=45792 RepID=UPI0034CF02E8
MSQELEEEVFSINTIYEECMVMQSTSIYVVHPPVLPELSIQISFPSTYPAASPPTVLSFSVPPALDGYVFGPEYRLLDTQFFSDILHKCYVLGEVCVFDFLGELQERLIVDIPSSDDQRLKQIADLEAAMRDDSDSDDDAGIDDLGWSVSDPITDRKSTFVGRAIAVSSVEDAKRKLLHLKMTNKKVMKARHSMTAYRIKSDKGSVVVQDCDDDGESAAGGRLSHLLSIMELWNVMVVVSRWFGGVHIGPDRFKHINNAARDALVQGGFVEPSEREKEKAKKSEKKKK